MRYSFEWDPSKARENLRGHKISFERATTIFLDPYAISIFDDAHSQDEERWITLGLDRNGSLLVVVHTFRQIEPSSRSIRVVSACRATRREAKQYQEGDT